MSPQRQLRILITQSFDLEEIKSICFDLTIPYDELPGDRLSTKINALLIAVHRLNQLPTLHQILTEERPDTLWPSLDDLLAFNWADLTNATPLPPVIENRIEQQINHLNINGNVINLDGVSNSKDNAAGEISINFTVNVFQEIDTQLKIEKHESVKIDYEIMATRYLQKMAELHGYIHVLGQHRSMPLGQVFTDVYLYGSPTRNYSQSIDTLVYLYGRYGRLSRASKRFNGIELAKKKKRLFILGQPGSGKTTFLKYLVMLAVGGELNQVPILISLNDLFYSNKTILEYIVEQFDFCELSNSQVFIQHLLTSGKALVLFDGLDEVSKSENNRLSITRILRQFINKFDEASLCHYLSYCCQ